MTPKTPAQRKRDERSRKAEKGLLEVRGIYAKKENHERIKKYASKIKD